MRSQFFSTVRARSLVWAIGSLLVAGVASGCVRTSPAPNQPMAVSRPRVPPAVPQGPMLKIIPSQAALRVGDSFTVSIVLQAQGNPIDGVDLRWLHFDPALLTAQDANPQTPGVEIMPGTLMPLTIYNVVEPEAGKISFSQVVAPGTTFTGRGEQVLATAAFTATHAGTAAFRLDFSAGATTDANVTSAGNDILADVRNSEVVIQAR